MLRRLQMVHDIFIIVYLYFNRFRIAAGRFMIVCDPCSRLVEISFFLRWVLLVRIL
jgi:hypothetical protein